MCAGSFGYCDVEKLGKLYDAADATKGPVCSRLMDEEGQFLSFPSMKDLVKELCDKKVGCALGCEAYRPGVGSRLMN